eukprot:GEMP01000051.1.p1 GENE.GEMP01000051.1~~GEMP01000051.1.p1  ORF type:complete len:3850 (+),score=729.91 GEMP01000051.1:79-11628(+)
MDARPQSSPSHLTQRTSQTKGPASNTVRFRPNFEGIQTKLPPIRCDSARELHSGRATVSMMLREEKIPNDRWSPTRGQTVQEILGRDKMEGSLVWRESLLAMNTRQQAQPAHHWKLAKEEENEEEEPVETAREHLMRIRMVYAPDADEQFVKVLNHADPTGAELDRQIEKITTGEDAISYFASGSVSDVRFLYLNRAPCPANEFRPYDLVVVADKERDPEYFTISQTGVVLMCPNKPSEHISLADWMHQQMMFQVLTTMTFFKHYLHRKMLDTWKANVRHSMYRQTRLKLVRTAFWAKPIFAKRMKQIQNISYLISTTNILHVETQLYQLQEFIDSQQKLQTLTSAKNFDTRFDMLAQVVDNVVVDVLASAKLPEKSKKTKIRSIVQEKMEKRSLARHMAIAHHDVACLSEYIRMVDMMAHSRIMDVAASGAQHVLEKLQSKTFSVTVKFGESDDHIEFVPPLSEFLTKFQQLFDHTVVLVNHITPLMSMRRFDRALLEKKQLIEGNTFRETLNSHQPYQGCLKEIELKIKDDFHRAQAYSDTYFEPYRAIYNFGEKWDEEAYVSSTHSHHTLARGLTEMEEYVDDLEKLKTVAMIGSLFLEARTLKSQLVPITERGLTCMKRMLQQFTRERCKIVTSKFEKVVKDLDQRPNTLEAFSDYVDQFQKFKAEMNTYDDWRANIEDLFLMISHYDVKVSVDDMMALDTLHAVSTDLTQHKMIEASSFIRENVASMIVLLEEKSLTLKIESNSIRDTLMTGSYVEATQTADVATLILEELIPIRQTIDEIKEGMARINECERLFKKDRSTFEEIIETEEVFTEMLHIWELIVQWFDEENRWLNSDLESLDVELVHHHLVQAHQTALNSWEHTNNILPLTAWLRDQHAVWLDRLPLLADLTNPTLKQRHWDMIRALMSSQPDLFTKPTVSQWLGAATFSEIILAQIRVISAHASGENGLESCLERITSTWQYQEIAVIAHGTTKDSFVFDDLTDIFDLLANHYTVLRLMPESYYYEIVAVKVEQLLQKLKHANKTLTTWKELQDKWVFTQPFFANLEGIPRETLDQWAIIDKFWKDSTKRVRSSYKTVLQAVSQPSILTNLQTSLADIVEIGHSLECYLLEKQEETPQLFLFSEQELLRCLSSADPLHDLASLFVGVDEWGIEVEDEEQMEECARGTPRYIVSMKSGTEEVTLLPQKVDVTSGTGNFIGWVTKLDEAMHLAMLHEAKSAWATSPLVYGEEVEAWADKYCEQIVLLCCTMMLRHQTENAFQSKSPRPEFLSSLPRYSPHSIQCKRLVLEQTERDVYERMVELKADSLSFEWQMRLRYNSTSDSSSFLVHYPCDVCIEPYQYSYLGITPLFVQTLTSERVWVSLALAYFPQKARNNPEIQIACLRGEGRTTTCLQFAHASGRHGLVVSRPELLPRMLLAAAHLRYILIIKTALDVPNTRLIHASLSQHNPKKQSPSAQIAHCGPWSEPIGRLLGGHLRPIVMCKPDPVVICKGLFGNEIGKVVGHLVQCEMLTMKQVRANRFADRDVLTQYIIAHALPDKEIERKGSPTESAEEVTSATPSDWHLPAVLCKLEGAKACGELTPAKQLEVALGSRSPIVCVGPPMAGKSRAIRHCADQCIVHTLFFHPDAPYVSPFGHFERDVVGNTNGAATAQLTEGKWIPGMVPSDTTNAEYWVIIDDIRPHEQAYLTEDVPVNAIGIPILNRILFETCDLANCSPSFVSRCQIVYFPPLPDDTIANEWLATTHITQNLALECATMVRTVRESLELKTKAASSPHLASAPPPLQFLNTFGLLNTLISVRNGFDFNANDGDQLSTARLYTVYALVWTMGGDLPAEGRKLFNDNFRTCLREGGWVKEAGELREVEDLHTFVVDCKLPSGRVCRLEHMLKPVPAMPGRVGDVIFVSTVETKRIAFLFDHLAALEHHLFVTGPPRAGKTMALEDLENRCATVRFFTYHSTSIRARPVQNFVESKLTGTSQGELVAPPGLSVCILLDDVSMNHPFLRQLCDHGGAFNQQKRFWTIFQNLHTIVTSSRRELYEPPTRAASSWRILRHFHRVHFPHCEPESAGRIFLCHLRMLLQEHDESILHEHVLSSIVKTLGEVKKVYPPTPQHLHCSHVDLGMRWIEGILQLPVTVAKETPNVLWDVWHYEGMRTLGDSVRNPSAVKNILKEVRMLYGTSSDNVSLGAFEDAVSVEPSIFAQRDAFHDTKHAGYGLVDNDVLERRLTDVTEKINSAQLDALGESVGSLVWFTAAKMNALKILRHFNLSGRLRLILGHPRRSVLTVAAVMANAIMCRVPLNVETTSGFIEALEAAIARGKEEARQVCFVVEENERHFPNDWLDVLLSMYHAPDTMDKMRRVQVACVLSNDAALLRSRNVRSPRLFIDITYFDPWQDDAYNAVAASWIQDAVKHDRVPQTIVSKLSSLALLIGANTNPDDFVYFMRSWDRLTRDVQRTFGPRLQDYRAALKNLDEIASEIRNVRALESTSKGDEERRNKLKQLKATMKEIGAQSDTKKTELHDANISKTHTDESLLEATNDAVAVEKRIAIMKADATIAIGDAVDGLNQLSKTDYTAAEAKKTLPAIEQMVYGILLICDRELNVTEMNKVLATGADTLAQECGAIMFTTNEEKIRRLKSYYSVAKNLLEQQTDPLPHAFATYIITYVDGSEVTVSIDTEEDVHTTLINQVHALTLRTEEMYNKQSSLTNAIRELNAEREKTLQAINATSDVAVLSKAHFTNAVELQYLVSAETNEEWKKCEYELNDFVCTIPENALLAAAFVTFSNPALHSDTMSRDWYWQSLDSPLRASVNHVDIPRFLRSIDPIAGNEVNKTLCQIVARGRDRWPLLIDPAGNGRKWLMHALENYNPLVVKHGATAELITSLECAMRHGNPVLIDLALCFGPVVERCMRFRPVMRSAASHGGSRETPCLTLNDQEMSVSFSFCIYFYVDDPLLAPEHIRRMVAVDFTPMLTDTFEHQITTYRLGKEQGLLHMNARHTLRVAAHTREKFDGELIAALAHAEAHLLYDSSMVKKVRAIIRRTVAFSTECDNAERLLTYFCDIPIRVAVRECVVYFGALQDAYRCAPWVESNIDMKCGKHAQWCLSAFVGWLEHYEPTLANVVATFGNLFATQRVIFLFLLCVRRSAPDSAATVEAQVSWLLEHVAASDCQMSLVASVERACEVCSQFPSMDNACAWVKAHPQLQTLVEDTPWRVVDMMFGDDKCTEEIEDLPATNLEKLLLIQAMMPSMMMHAVMCYLNSELTPDILKGAPTHGEVFDAAIRHCNACTPLVIATEWTHIWLQRLKGVYCAPTQDPRDLLAAAETAQEGGLWLVIPDADTADALFLRALDGLAASLRKNEEVTESPFRLILLTYCTFTVRLPTPFMYRALIVCFDGPPMAMEKRSLLLKNSSTTRFTEIAELDFDLLMPNKTATDDTYGPTDLTRVDYLCAVRHLRVQIALGPIASRTQRMEHAQLFAGLQATLLSKLEIEQAPVFAEVDHVCAGAHKFDSRMHRALFNELVASSASTPDRLPAETKASFLSFTTERLFNTAAAEYQRHRIISLQLGAYLARCLPRQADGASAPGEGLGDARYSDSLETIDIAGATVVHGGVMGCFFRSELDRIRTLLRQLRADNYAVSLDIQALSPLPQSAHVRPHTWGERIRRRIDYIVRIASTSSWPPSLWLGAFWRPDFLIVALKQRLRECTASSSLHLDDIQLRADIARFQSPKTEELMSAGTSFPAEMAQRGDNGMFVHGLHFDGGGRWDPVMGNLMEAQIGVSYSSMTIVYLYVETATKQAFIRRRPHNHKSEAYKCPVFQARNSRLVFTVELPCKGKQWALRGLALLLNIPEE